MFYKSVLENSFKEEWKRKFVWWCNFSKVF